MIFPPGTIQSGKQQLQALWGDTATVTRKERVGNGIAFVADNANWLIPVVGGVVVGLLAYKAATMAATLWTTLATVAVGGLTGNWAAAIGVIAAVTAGAWGLSKAFSSIDAGLSTESLSGLKNTAGTALKNIPVEISNTDPLKVTGEVDIEKENLKYLMDIAGAKFFAKFSTATLAPQVNIYGQTIEKTVDADEVISYVTTGLADSVAATAQGDYSYA
ncbi:hypothetical protein [Hydrogenoanaerobacterium sp.]|uniref:hypothetical protein n=1 Tax=Hydrogenoanaerobacterium sp. TaxID=2953763 RepID=UPI0028A16547|nr:hypothetical protein [Hydrogenoanaerobacterium sp.]